MSVIRKFVLPGRAMALVFVFVATQAATSKPPPLSAYGTLPAFEQIAISRSGDLVAEIGVGEEDRRLTVVDRSLKPVFSVPLGDAKVRGLYWAGDQQIVVLTSQTMNLGVHFVNDKAERYEAIVVPVAGDHSPRAIFAGDPRITIGIQACYGIRERSGRWYGYFTASSLERDGLGEAKLLNTNPVLYEVDLATGNVHMLASRADAGVYRSWMLGRDGSVRATLDYVSSSGQWFIHSPLRRSLATGISRLGGIALVALGNDDTTLIYTLTDEKSGENHWFETPLNATRPQEMLGDVGIAEGLKDPGSDQLAGYAGAGDLPAYHFFDGHRQKVVDATMKAFPGHIVTLVSWDAAFDRLIVKTEGGADPQSWWLIDVATGKADPIGDSYPIPPEDVGPVTMIRYPAGDGLSIGAVLTLPRGRPPHDLPVVVFPHGGPGERDWMGFDWLAQAFASRGYAVLQPNFRGSTGYGAAFMRAGNGEWGKRMQTDISDGLAYLAQAGVVDPKRACIVGISYGGYAALAGVTLQHGLYRCAVSVAGISDVGKLVTDLSFDNGADPLLSRSLAQQVGSGANLSAISPIRYADRADAPILLIHGKDDTVVRYVQSREMAAALHRAGKTAELVTLPAEDHWLSHGATRQAMLKATVEFVERYDPPDGRVDPAD